MLPSLFIAHGAPVLSAGHHKDILRQLAFVLPKPRAVVLFSAHWLNPVQQIGGAGELGAMRGYDGFSKELNRMNYPLRGNWELAEEVEQLLLEEGINCRTDEERGPDHCTRVVMWQMYPHSDIPVVMLSVNPRLAPEEQYRTGMALRSLRSRNILVIGCGGMAHHRMQTQEHGNESERGWKYGLERQGEVERECEVEGGHGSKRGCEAERQSEAERDRQAEPQTLAAELDRWLEEQLEIWNTDALFDYEGRAPHASEAVTAKEHLVPLFISMGAADDRRSARRLQRSRCEGSPGLSCWLFG